MAPADGATGQPLNTSISVTFSRSANPSTVTVNTANTVCKGTLQLSSNNFVRCVQMGGAPNTTDNTTFTVSPRSSLASGTTYKIRVTSGVQANDGVPATPFTQPNGFTTQ